MSSEEEDSFMINSFYQINKTDKNKLKSINISVEKFINTGGHSIVWRGKQDNQLLAIKIVNKYIITI